MNKLKIGFVSLGCDKNRVDTETMLYKLKTGGYEIVSDAEEADIIVVNTCAFLEAARRESIDAVLDMNEYRKFGKLKKIIVTGCLAKLSGKEIFDGLTEADCVCGIGSDICAAVEKTMGEGRQFLPCEPRKTVAEPRLTTTPSHYAYLKISDGCDNFCSYCLIPHIRGRYSSAPKEQLVEQAEKLCADGVSELILVAQDVTKYGTDLYGKSALTDLLTELTQIGGLKRIRLLYCYPELITDELLDLIKNNGKICKYIDVPLQHADTDVLRRMNRRSDYKSLCGLFDKLKTKYPEIKVRSTFISGFPGETEAQHKKIIEFLNKYRFYNVGFFAYSREEGTPAANFPDRIDEKTKKRRVKELYGAQEKIARSLNKELVGKTIECVVDEKIGETYVGRADFQSPEIDGVVKITSDKPLTAGEYVRTRITAYDKYDLIGEVKK